MRLVDVTGERFGRLVVVGRSAARNTRILWDCACDCGGRAITDSTSLRSGHTRSCGCYQLERNIQAATKHGCAGRGEKARTYKIWLGMIDRCYREKNQAFSNYGGRGIEVCDRWREAFQNFIDDMGPVPALMSIERINNDDNYAPGNCRWATTAEQNRNARSNVVIRSDGLEMIAAEFAKKIGMKATTFRAALKRGERVFNGIQIVAFKRGSQS